MGRGLGAEVWGSLELSLHAMRAASEYGGNVMAMIGWDFELCLVFCGISTGRI